MTQKLRTLAVLVERSRDLKKQGPAVYIRTTLGNPAEEREGGKSVGARGLNDIIRKPSKIN